MPELLPRATPTAKSSATKAVPTSSSRTQTGGPSLGQQQQQAKTPLQAQKQQPKNQEQRNQQKKRQQEFSFTERTRAPPPAKSNSTASPKESQQTSRSDLSRGSKERTAEDPSDPVVVNYQGPNRFYSFAEKEKMWDYVMKNIKLPAGTKKPEVKQPQVKK